MQKYAIQVPSSKDYPLREFEGKENEVDGQIGYGKGSMVFHMLRRLVGKDLFFATLKAFSRSHGGKQATWKDIQKSFEESSGRKLENFFSQWLDRPGGPKVKLEGVKSQVTSKGYLASGEGAGGEIYDFPLTAEVDEGAGKRSLLLEVSKRRTPFSMEGPRSPLSLTVDPDHQVFRRLYPEEIVPCLNALLEDRDKVIVLPERGDEESRKIYADLAKGSRTKSGRIVSEKELTEAESGMLR
jgi:aminopeptidase N